MPQRSNTPLRRYSFKDICLANPPKLEKAARATCIALKISSLALRTTVVHPGGHRSDCAGSSSGASAVPLGFCGTIEGSSANATDTDGDAHADLEPHAEDMHSGQLQTNEHVIAQRERGIDQLAASVQEVRSSGASRTAVAADSGSLPFVHVCQ
mgnify:CR=1 FL=1